MKYFGNIDLKGNYISNVAIENRTTANINSDDYNKGRIQFDVDKNSLMLDLDSKRTPIYSGNVYSNVEIIRKTSGNIYLDPKNYTSSLRLSEGENTRFDVDELTGIVKFNANVNYTANNFSTSFGDSSNTSYLIEHNLGTPNVVVAVLINQGASVHPDLIVKQLEVIDSNNVKITLNVDPDGENLTAVINSKHGDKGPQGPQGNVGANGNVGATGPQGPPMSNMLQYSGAAVGNALIITANGNVTTSNVISFTDNGSNRSLNISTNNILGTNITNNHDYSTSSAQTLTLNAKVNSEGDKINVRYLTFKSQVDTGPVTQIMSIDGYGRLFSNYLLSNVTANTLVGITPLGYLETTNLFTDDAILIKKKKIVITSNQIKTSYNTPIVLIPAPMTGQTINPIDITVKYTYGTTPYSWVNSAVIQLNGATNRFLDIDPAILNGTRTAYQKTNISFIENVGVRYLIPNTELLFKTINSNPTSGDGTLTIEVKYTLIDF